MTDDKNIVSLRNIKRVKLLITPSWVSVLFCICCAFVVLIGVVFASNYQGTRYQQQVAEIRAKQINPHYSSEDTEFEGLEGNTFIDIIPVLVLWGIIGIVVFFFAISIIRVIQQTVSFKSELEYTNANRQEMLKTAFLHLAIRLSSGALCFLFTLLFIKIIFPYSIDSAMATSAIGISPISILYSGLCLLTVGFSVHLYVVFTRLMFMKPRLFTNIAYL